MKRLNQFTNQTMLTKRLLLTFLWVVCMSATTHAQLSTTTAAKKMKFLIHITCGPDNPTKAALGFLVAKTALEEGHTVALFLAGDAVTLLKDSELDKVVGLGTGKLRDHFDAISKAGGRFYMSGMSSKARGLTDADITGKPAEFAMPTILVRLATDSDRMFTY
ncbi:DsrE family protein [Spirosoma sp. KCTC 42546]|uniref:DsrE family protein n=1 Tax=Spirosoma sp. KCTC 42546 TaxID=2520506 RepID=UPI001FEF952F|nr:DsrE family protein [Spirosoma sp. KCTC 42546]